MQFVFCSNINISCFITYTCQPFSICLVCWTLLPLCLAMVCLALLLLYLVCLQHCLVGWTLLLTMGLFHQIVMYSDKCYFHLSVRDSIYNYMHALNYEQQLVLLFYHSRNITTFFLYFSTHSQRWSINVVYSVVCHTLL